MEIIFETPQYLFFLLSIPLLIIIHYTLLRFVRGRVLQFANFAAMSRVSTPMIKPRNFVQLILRILVLALIVLAVAGMHFNYTGSASRSDYVIAIDSSSSMTAVDFTPSRIDSAKQAAETFVESSRLSTKIGIVTFAGTAFVEQKLTNDKSLLIDKIRALKITKVGGTDIGEAIISSTNLLISSQTSKTVILLTDGRSNIGVGIDRALDYANENNVQVYTIGIGTKQGSMVQGVNITLELDEDLLERIAQSTEAEYIHAESPEEIEEAYNQILTSTKKKISIELTLHLMILTLILSFIDWTMMNTRYRRIP